MVSSKKLRQRLTSIESIKNVSKSMGLMSMVKYERIKRKIEQERGIKEIITEIITAITNKIETTSKLILNAESTENFAPKKTGIIIIGSDRGLCGGYNISVVKKAKEIIKHNKDNDFKFYTIGKKIPPLLKKVTQNYVDTNLFLHEDLLKFSASNIAKQVVIDFLDDKIDSVKIVYSKSINLIETNIRIDDLLPLKKDQFVAKKVVRDNKNPYLEKDYILEPNLNELLYTIVPIYISSIISSDLEESLFAEHLTRRMAMKTAVENAEESIYILGLELNKIRQSKITQEVIEIVSARVAKTSSDSSK